MSTIILVDDNENIRNVFTLYLSFIGHTIHAVEGGTECLELLKTVHPDLILLDIMMPGIDGWETLSAIKENPATVDVPITMCSGKLPDLEEINRYGTHIDEYLVKPLGLSTLSASVTSTIQRSVERNVCRERLKREIPDHQVIEEYYASTRKLYLLEKFSRYFTADDEKTESTIRHHRMRLSEIRTTLDHPVLWESQKCPITLTGEDPGAVFPSVQVVSKPLERPGSMTIWTNQENTAGIHHEL